MKITAPRLAGVLGVSVCTLFAQTALIRHAPVLNGNVEGSLHQMTAENTTLNGGANVSGNLLVPGTPEVRLNGKPNYGGTLDGNGSATPTSYSITLNGGATLGHVVRRTDAIVLPSVEAPPLPAGTRNVSLNTSGESPGDFATLKNLTLGGSAGPIALPPGTYGDFTANGSSSFILGTAGSTSPTIYNFQHLVLNGSSHLDVVGPVIMTLANGMSANGSIGDPVNPVWITLNLASGDLTLNGNVSVYGNVTVPSGKVTINGNSQLVGGLVSDQLTINGKGLLRLLAPPTANQPPTISLTAPSDGASFTAPAAFTLAATATDADGTVARVEFYQGATKLGEDSASPYELSLSGVGAGSYTYTARAIDNLGASADSSAVTVTVTSPNQPPTVTLTAPLDGSLYTAPAIVDLLADAVDSDGSITKVSFYQGTTNIGDDFNAPYGISTALLPVGTYVFSAVAEDNLGATTTSSAITVTLVAPNQSPSVSLTAPADESTFTAPAEFSLIAAAADADGTIAKVEFFQDAVLLGEDTAAPYELPVTGLAAGIYHFVARATDNADSSTDSSPITVTVESPVSLALPFLAGFEPAEGYTLGPLDGQLGWTASSLSIVTDADYFSGVQSALIPGNEPPLTLARTFDPHPAESVVFVDLYTLPLAAADVSTSARFATLNVAQVAFVGSGGTGSFHVFNGNGTAGGTWQNTSPSLPLDTGGYAADWVRQTLRIDYTEKKWDLYVGGVMVAVDLGFAQNAQSELGSFTLTGHTTAYTLIDEFLAAFDNPIFADVDKDGMDDAWETAHGLNPAINDRNGDLDGDGISNIQEYLLGTDPDNSDTDGDGLSDAQEISLGTNPNSADSDGDGLPDGWEQSHGLDPLSATDAVLDSDGDGVSNAQEYIDGTNPVDFYNGRAFALNTVLTGAGASVIAYTYDASGRIVLADYAESKTIQFTHSDAGNLTAVTSAGIVGSATDPIVDWRTAHGLPADGTGDGADEAILANDGLPNLAKYAFGLDPYITVADEYPEVSLTTISGSTYLTLTYSRPDPMASDLTYTVEVSNDGTTWTSGPNSTVEVSATINNGVATIVVRDATPVGSPTLNRRIRLMIERRAQF